MLYAAAIALLLRGISPARPEGPAGWTALNHGVLAGWDTVTHDYPAYWWGWSQIRETGQIPLWNPSWFCGLPFIASQTFMPFYPGNWLGGCLAFPLAFNFQYPLHLWLAALVMLCALRARGLGWWAAGLGGLCWGLGGHLATLAGPGHIQKLQTLVWLPLVTLGARECALALFTPQRMRRAAACLGAGLALQVVAGHPQVLYLTLLASACEWLAVLVIHWNRGAAAPASETAADQSLHATLSQDADEFDADRPPTSVRHHWGALITSIVLGGALAFGLSAVFWIPTAEFAQLSNRKGALAWEDQTRGSLPPEEAFEFVLPRLLGDSMPQGRGAYLGRYGESGTSSPERIVSDYAGAAALLLVFFALLGGGPRRRAAAGYLALGAAVLLLSFGKYWPGFYRLALQIVPGLGHLRSPSTMLALLSYGLASAAALGAESLLAPLRPQLGTPLPWRLRVYGPLLLFFILLSLRMSMAGMPRWGVQELAEAPNLQRLMLRHTALLQVLVPALTLSGLLLIFNLACFFVQSPGLRQAARWLLLLALPLVAARDLVQNAQPFWKAEPLAPYRQFLTRFWPTEFWSREDAPVRFYEWGNELTNRALTLSDFHTMHSVGTLHGYHPVGYQRYFELLSRLGFASADLHPNLLRLFAINYLLWPEQGGPPVPPGYFEIARQEGKRLLYNPDIAYVRPIKHLKTIPNWPIALARLSDPNFNVYDSTTVTYDQVEEKARGKSSALKPLELQTRVLTRAPGEVQLNCRAARFGNVVVSEPAVPGWRVYINGILARNNVPQVVDGFFLSVPVDAGNTRVQLNYDPASQRLGLYVTCLALGLLGFLAGRRCAWPRLRKKGQA
jgi:hypothetical protein